MRKSKQSLFAGLNRPMHGRLWTFSGRGGRKEVTWWGRSSISTMKNGCAGVRDRLNAGNALPATFGLPSPLSACRQRRWRRHRLVLRVPDEGLHPAGRQCFPAEVQHCESSVTFRRSLEFGRVSPEHSHWCFLCVCSTALQCHHEVHQSAPAAAQRAHAQPHGERAQLDGLSAGLLPRSAGQQRCRRLLVRRI